MIVPDCYASRMHRTLPLLAALTFSLATAAQTTQYAGIVKAVPQGQTLSLTLNYIDFFVLGDPAGDAQAMKLGGYKTKQELYDANPAGWYARDINPKLRTLKTDAKTVFELVCLKLPGGVIKVNRDVFLAAYQGKNPIPDCNWDFAGGMVKMRLEGTRILRITQQYLP